MKVMLRLEGKQKRVLPAFVINFATVARSPAGVKKKSSVACRYDENIHNFFLKLNPLQGRTAEEQYGRVGSLLRQV